LTPGVSDTAVALLTIVEIVRTPLLERVSTPLALYESTQILSFPLNQERMILSVPLAVAVRLMGAAGTISQEGCAGRGLGIKAVMTAGLLLPACRQCYDSHDSLRTTAGAVSIL